MRVDLQGGSVEFKARESVLSKIEASLQPGFEPVQPKYAATVMLVRDSAPFQTEYRIESDHFPPDFPTGQELEVFMLRRVKTMEFVPDAVVFPGGRVDDRDSNPNLPLLPNGLSSWAAPRMWRDAWLLLLRARCSRSAAFCWRAPTSIRWYRT